MVLHILDHGDDPGRYTIIYSDGLIVTCNENGQPVFRRRCRKPMALVQVLSREKGMRSVKPSKNRELIRKVDNHLKYATK